MNEKTYAIIGNGAIGAGIALYLNGCGLKSVIVERGDYFNPNKVDIIIDTAWEGANDPEKRANYELQFEAGRLAIERIENAIACGYIGRYVMIGSQAEWEPRGIIEENRIARECNRDALPYGEYKRRVCNHLLASPLDSCWIRLSGVVYANMQDSIFKRAATRLVDYDSKAIWNTLPLMVACGAIARIADSSEHGIVNLGGRNMMLRDMVNAASGCPKMHNEKGKSKSCMMEVKRAQRYIPKHDILAELTRLGKIWRGEA